LSENGNMKGRIMRRGGDYVILLSILFCLKATHGQVLGPTLQSRDFEVGYQYKFFHRKLTTDYRENEWTCNSIFVRYGVNKWITLSGELSVFLQFHPESTDSDYRLYVFGMGVTSRAVKFGNFHLGFTFHYCENLLFDRSQLSWHHVYKNFVGGMQLDYDVHIKTHHIMITVLPGYFYDEDALYSCSTHDIYIEKSQNNIGLMAGVNVLFMDHVDIFGHFVYADYFQPRIGVALRL
jgi:hypothetical protein